MQAPTDADLDREKLFDWKRGGSYAWKASFPLSRGERPVRTGAPQENTAKAGEKHKP